jgi:phosphatidylinositol 4-kinase type 2
MFARQIAVMKGQAWNVVETLKMPDHGPLELTRRAKVCVWDDLVDIPVAVPMRDTSSELRRSNGDYRRSMDEGDIGAAISASASTEQSADDDLLGMATPPAGMPHPGRFELTISPKGEGAQSPDELSMNGSGILGAGSTAGKGIERPSVNPPAGRASYHGSRALNMYAPARQQQQHHHHQQQQQQQQQRRYSFATATTRRNRGSIAQQLYGDTHEYDDDVEGDLGYAAAEGMEGNQRKVIVERLEPVKSKNPVFTWC